MNKAILVVGADPCRTEALTILLQREGRTVICEENVSRGIAHAENKSVNIVFADLASAGWDGLQVLMRAGAAVIVTTTKDSVESCVRAFRLGVADYLTEPFRTEAVAAAISRAAVVCASTDMGGHVTRPSATAAPTAVATPLISESRLMKRVVSICERVAVAPVPILCLGEIGVGKEAIVRLIHSLSPERNGPFVKVNCEALSEEGLAEFFFGRESTGNGVETFIERGAIERAAGGVLFLHDFVKLPVWLQADLLRAAKSGQFLRRGGSAPVRFDVRFAATATRELSDYVRSGELLDDFCNFLHVVPLHVPPLRDRREDIRPLITQIANEDSCLEVLGTTRRQPHFDEDALMRLHNYDWPGNIYELSNFVRRAMVFAPDLRITTATVEDLLPSQPTVRRRDSVTVPLTGDYKVIERAIVEEVILHTNGNKAAAARALGLHRRTLYRIIENGPNGHVKLAGG